MKIYSGMSLRMSRIIRIASLFTCTLRIFLFSCSNSPIDCHTFYHWNGDVTSRPSKVMPIIPLSSLITLLTSLLLHCSNTIPFKAFIEGKNSSIQRPCHQYSSHHEKVHRIKNRNYRLISEEMIQYNDSYLCRSNIDGSAVPILSDKKHYVAIHL